MSSCQVYSFMPGVVIELTTSALQGLSERTAKCWDTSGKSYSITLPCGWTESLWSLMPLSFVQANCQVYLSQKPIYFIKTLLISPLSQIIIKCRPCPEMLINDERLCVLLWREMTDGRLVASGHDLDWGNYHWRRRRGRKVPWSSHFLMTDLYHITFIADSVLPQEDTDNSF